MPLLPPWSETFRAAIEEGVRDIAGELRKLNADEKRQLLADLRKLDDCPKGWKNTDSKKQRSILKNLHQAIERLVDPEKAKAASARNGKKRKENGKQEESNARNDKKRRENGKQEEYTKKYNADPINKEKRAKYNHEYNADPINKERQAKYNHEYQADPINKDKTNARRRERYDTDIKFRTMCILRARLYAALKNNKKDHTMDLLGCTVEQSVQHIEKQFKPGMTWDNQGKADDEWEIDHIIPFVAFDVSNRDEQFIVSWYQNLQPLWGPANRSKSGKYTEEGKQDLIRRYNEHKK